MYIKITDIFSLIITFVHRDRSHFPLLGDLAQASLHVVAEIER